MSVTVYIPGQHDNSINIQTVYTATTQMDFMRIITEKMVLTPFIINRKIFNILKVLNIEISKA